MNAMCEVIIIKVLQRNFGIWFHEITHICNIYLLNPACRPPHNFYCPYSWLGPL